MQFKEPGLCSNEERLELRRVLESANGKTICMAGSIKRIEDVSISLLIKLIEDNDWQEIYDDAIMGRNNFNGNSFIKLWQDAGTDNDKLDLLTFAGSDKLLPVYKRFTDPKTHLFFLNNLDSNSAAWFAAVLLQNRNPVWGGKILNIGDYYIELLGLIARFDYDFKTLFGGVAYTLNNHNLYKLKKDIVGAVSINPDKKRDIIGLLDAELARRANEREEADRKRKAEKEKVPTLPACDNIEKQHMVAINLFDMIKDVMTTRQAGKKL